jgi:arginase
MGDIRLLIVPYELGGLREGVGRGPERLLERGALEALRSCGAAVRTEVLELRERTESEADACFALIRLVADRVAAAVREGAFPVILSGSCSVAVGIVAGLGERSPRVLWLDAHADFNTPATTIEGYFDGMGLAVLTGSAWQGLLATVEGARPLPETAVVLAGARDFDEPEKERLDDEQLNALVAEVLDDQPVRALSLTAYDPSGDAEHRVPPVALGLLELVARRVARASG